MKVLMFGNHVYDMVEPLAAYEKVYARLQKIRECDFEKRLREILAYIEYLEKALAAAKEHNQTIEAMEHEDNLAWAKGRAKELKLCMKHERDKNYKKLFKAMGVSVHEVEVQ
jgi:hypothetical protein